MTRSLLILDANYESIRRIGPWLTAEIDLVGAPHLSGRLGEIELAVHELATNVINHALDAASRAGATFELAMWCVADALLIESVDTGRPFEEADRPDITDRITVGGYGLFIVEQLTDRVTYERVGAANRWTLWFSSPR